MRNESDTRNLIKSFAEEAAKYERTLNVAVLDPGAKAARAREIRKDLTTLGLPTKLVGADAKRHNATTIARSQSQPARHERALERQGP